VATAGALLLLVTLVRPPKKGRIMADNIAEDALRADALRHAIRLRVKGAHWSEIADACGFPSPAAALAAVGRAMADATLRAEETADSMRNTANLRLEHLLGETLRLLESDAPVRYDEDGNDVTPDDRAVKLRAVDEARRLVESITKLNGVATPDKDTGADGPMQIQIVGVDPADLT
jgi:hypothetical protein